MWLESNLSQVNEKRLRHTLGRQSTRRCKRNQAAAFFIPQIKAGAFQALHECHSAAFNQFAVVTQDLRQAVKRDAAVQMMDMVDAYVGRKPAQNGR